MPVRERYQPTTPDDVLAPDRLSVRMTHGQVKFVTAIAAAEQSSRATVVRRLLNEGLRLHHRLQRLREAEGVDA